jgi:hypothetical protein
LAFGVGQDFGGSVESLSSKLATRSDGVLEYWSTVPVFELHLATARLGKLKGR